MSMKEELSRIVGKERVLDDPQALEEFSGDHSSAPPKKPSLVVRASNNEEIKHILELANKTGFSLIPVSSSPPRFHGDTVPSEEGVVILDLREMNTISSIDRRNRVAIIEPGVTFGELETELKKEGLRIIMPLCPKPGKSVIASCWEREPVTAPRFHWDVTDPLLSTEFIVGRGDSMWTGEVGINPGTLEEQKARGYAFVVPFGVSVTNVGKMCGGSQGTLGMCTWASIRCEVLPEHEQLFVLQGEKLDELTDPASQLLYNRLADDLFILNSVNLACLLRKEPDAIRKLIDELPPWILIFTIVGYGVKAGRMFDYKLGEVEDMKVELVELPGVSNEELQGLLRTPSEEPYWKLRLKGDVRGLFFQTSLAKAPAFVELVQGLAAEANFSTSDMGVYVQLQRQGAYCHLEFDFNVSPDSEEVKKVENLIFEAGKKVFSQGGFFSRPYGELSDMVYSNYSNIVPYLKGIKQIFDPNGVMSPGKLCY